ncbi:MAG TPA: hypothetical protein VNK04_13335 [Gemmataceae bacterium]|nr:hypothetical protein [Gemmataceae bacterium]
MDCILFTVRRLAAASVVVFCLVGLVGCGRSGPKTHPVKGKVVSEKAGVLQKLAGSSIELRSEVEPNTRGFGILEPDGSFTISTYRLGESLPGAIEGKHRARIMIDMGDEDDDRPRKKKWPIDPKYTRFETSGWEITVPTDGEVLLKLP